MISEGNEPNVKDIGVEEIEVNETTPESPMAQVAKEYKDVKRGEYMREIQYNDCKVHSDKKQDMFCHTCKKTVCERCAYLNHREKHNVNDLWDVVNEKEKEFTLQKDILKFQIQPKYQQAILDMETEFEEMSEIYDQTRRKIKLTAEEWHRNVDDFINNHLKTVDKMEEAYKSHLGEEKSKLEDILTQIQKEVEESERLLVAPVELVEKEVPNLEKFKRFPKISRADPPVFYIGSLQDVIDHQIKQEKRIGYLHDLPIPYNAALNKSCVCLAELGCLKKRIYPEYEIQTGIANRPKFDNLSTQNQNYKSLHDIQALSDEKALVSDSEKGLYVIDKDGSVPMSQELEGIQCFTLSGGNDMYYTDEEGKRIVKMQIESLQIPISQEGVKIVSTDRVVSTEDWVPKGITKTKSGNILACLQKEEGGKIAKYSQSLKTLHFESNDSQPYVERPERIVENRNGDICVTNVGREGSVYIFTRNGRIKSIYRPVIASNAVVGFLTRRDTSFQPDGICTDRMGQILISDAPNKVIHVLNQWGEFIQFLLRNSIQDPGALSVDDNGNLWIIEENKKIKIVKYLNGYL